MNPKITIVGRLGKDPEAIGSGARFTVATKDRVKNDKGEWEDRDTSWWTVKAWKTLGQQALSSLKKGQEVIIYGTIYQENWKDSNGNEVNKKISDKKYDNLSAVLEHLVAKIS